MGAKLPKGGAARIAGFTLIELITAMAVSLMLMVLLFSVIEQISRTTQRASGSASAFDDARIAFAAIQSRLVQATLSPYWTVSYDSAGNPKGYSRMSDLHFIFGPASRLIPDEVTSGSAIFFLAPLGVGESGGEPAGSLNACGFFVEYRDANSDSPLHGLGVVPAKWRFQLRAFQQPSERLSVFNAATPSTNWWGSALHEVPDPVEALAENVALLIFRARTFKGAGETAYYEYDSRIWNGTGNQPATSHQLPQAMDVLMLALDSRFAERLATGGTAPEICPPDLFLDPTLFDEDVGRLEQFLTATYPQASFRVFRATLPIRSAKWSQDSTAFTP